MDELDARIVNALSRDSRTAFLEIARRLRVSEGTVRKRVRAMRKRGDIKRFSVELGARPNAGGVGAIVGLKTDPHVPTGKVAGEISKISGVKSVFEVAGSFDVFCIASAESAEGLNAVLEKMRGLRGVVSSEAYTVLREVVGDGL